MSTQPEYTPEQAAALLAAAQQRQAAQESAAITQQAAESAAAMTERGPLLPAESEIDAVMAALKAQSDQIARLTSQLTTMQRAQDEALAAVGGPLTIRYAQAAADKLSAHAAAWPAHDLSGAASAAGDLLSAAAAAVAGEGSAGSRLQAAEAAVRRHVSRLPHIDFSAVLDDAALAAEEGLKLLAAA